MWVGDNDAPYYKVQLDNCKLITCFGEDEVNEVTETSVVVVLAVVVKDEEVKVKFKIKAKVETKAKVKVEVKVEEEDQGGESGLAEARDMLEAVIRHTAAAATDDSQHTKDQVYTMQLLLERLKEVADTLLDKLPELSDKGRASVSTAVKAYFPSKGAPNDEAQAQWYPAERELLQSLTDITELQTQITGPAAPAVELQKDHPVRVTRLLFALMSQIWTTKPSFFGKVPLGSCYSMSYEAKRCTYFVSHSWRDDGRRKVQMLREFLFMQSLVGRTLVISLVLACFLFPFGFAIRGFFPSLPAGAAYVPSAIPLSLLALVLLWSLLSLLGLMPPALAPWALSTSSIWIDKTGIDQTRAAAGVAAFPRILASCDKFVGLISPSYFHRLWCVYELATFTHMHSMHLVDASSGKMLLLSLDWRSSFFLF